MEVSWIEINRDEIMATRTSLALLVLPLLLLAGCSETRHAVEAQKR